MKYFFGVEKSIVNYIKRKINNMETVKQIINHPLSKAVACGVIGALLIAHSHALYSGIAFGMGLREFLLAFKK